MLTQITMEAYTQIVQVCSRSLAKAKTWQSPLLTEQHDNSPCHKAVPSSLPANMLFLLGGSKILQLEIIYLHLKSANTVSCISSKHFPNFFLNLPTPLEEGALFLFKGQGDGGTGRMNSVLLGEIILQAQQFLVCSARSPFSNYLT